VHRETITVKKYSRVVTSLLLVAASAVYAPLRAWTAPQGALDIYFIDVEGGQATLIVTPAHQSMLVDAGFPGAGTFESHAGDPKQARDANRILTVARAAGVKQIDFFVATHFHGDHIGGVPELAKLLPIRTFVDHGSPSPDVDKTSPGSSALFKAYAEVRRTGRHLQPKPGDRLPLKGLDALVVSAAGAALTGASRGAGEAGPPCGNPLPPGEPYENPRSTGLLLTFGQFKFLDLGDLTGEPLYQLACPSSEVGKVEVYLVTHHGSSDAADPAVFAALSPRVAIMNNGSQKGGGRSTYESLHHVGGLLDTWQLHRSEPAGDQNFPDSYIANLDDSTSHWLKLTARRDGEFTVLNGRTGESKAYGPGQ
jgi:competence protein ComEC